MALKIKAVERLVKFDKNSAGTYRYPTEGSGKTCKGRERI